ncbi:hypothetical protein A3Q24_05390 [Lactobacillus johnsonii]|jgi:hypothetical protein|uniref:Uncharacterized protein n=1 Tax=Lactobacillus johnsonii TaxID=33959 RepID=A0A267M6N2_LACJH|nr:DUF6414 family protein [Lactobacillus johnsonii]PAB55117.1 hypothetical protein A3Q24_05390 [Lactobacillus johnsonii]
MNLREKEIPKKVIYFDEESAIDYLQIVNHGTISKSIETMTNLGGNAKGGADVEGGKDDDSLIDDISKKTIGLHSWVKASLNAGAKIGGSRLSKTTFSNSILFDFLNQSTKGRRKIDILKNYKLRIYPDTMAYYASLGPLTGMMEGNLIDDNENISIAVSKIGKVIKEAKGYYELVGEKNKNKIIVRFNINAFRNNYRIQDLEKMDLNLYCVKVGKGSINSLNFNSEFNLDDTNNTQDGYAETIIKSKKEETLEQLDIYDAFLAGVM